MTGKEIRKPVGKSNQSKAHPKRVAPKKRTVNHVFMISADSIPGKMLADVRGMVQDKMDQMKQADKKKLFLLNFPYVLFAYFINEIMWLYRISAGATGIDKRMETLNHFERAFESPLPSFYHMDLRYGIAGGIAVKLVVSYRAKNAKKYR
jgi:type IV secretion system protein VirD4